MICLIILAAGQASRLGIPKLLLPVQGQTLLRFTVERLLASPADATIVVLGAEADLLADELAGLPVRTVINDRYAEGLSTSLQAGLRALPPTTVAAIVALGDQPLVTADIVRTLIERYVETRAPIVYPSYNGQQGNPVLFDRQLFPELLTLSGDAGARRLIRAYGDAALAVSFATAEPLRDVDTWEDYEAVRRALGDDPYGQAPPARYCPRCGATVRWRLVERRPRPACTSCSAVVYEDPKVAVVALIEQDGRLLLAQRAHDPGKGRWSFPGGFVDRGEEVERALAREVWEETGLQISVRGLLGVYSRPGHPVIVIAYHATPSGGVPRSSSEALTLAFFAPDELPTMAFGSDERILADWRQTRAPQQHKH